MLSPQFLSHPSPQSRQRKDWNQTVGWGSLLAAVFLIAVHSVSACSVPVFRYAFERWEPDPYQVLIFHRGEPPQELVALANKIQEMANAEKDYANIEVATIDLDGKLDDYETAIWKAQKNPQEPWMVLRFPYTSYIKTDIWSGPPSEKVIQQFVNSPVRSELGKRLLDGQTCVWVVLECGDAKKDQAAFQLLEKQLNEMQKELKLPELREEDVSILGPGGPKLRIEFSTLKLQRNAEAEKMFVETLLHTEDDLKDFDEPMVFPIFGRGRAHFALVGKGINADNLNDYGRFLCGPCSCQVKSQNPGTDLLMTVGWRNRIGQGGEVEEPLPLLGLPSTIPSSVKPESGIAQNNPDQKDPNPIEPNQTDPKQDSPETAGSTTQGSHDSSTSNPGSTNSSIKAPSVPNPDRTKVAMNPLPVTQPSSDRLEEEIAMSSEEQNALGVSWMMISVLVVLGAGLLVVILGSVLVGSRS